MQAKYPELSQEIDTKVSIITVRDDQFLPWIKICAIALGAIVILWLGLAAFANWYSLIYLVKNPTVGSLLFFGLMWLTIAVSIMMVILSIFLGVTNLVHFMYKDDLTIALYTAIIVLIVGDISLLFYSFKVLSTAVNIAIILTMIYPLMEGIILIYIIAQIPVDTKRIREDID